VNRAAGIGPRPSPRDQCRLALQAHGVFFIFLLFFEIGMGDLWPWLSESEPQLPEVALTLSSPQADGPFLLD